MTSENEKREIIAQSLNNVLESGYIPELGEPKKGKVRDIYFKDDKVIMVASDRVSAFDQVLSRCIPFKGAVLNGISKLAMKIAGEVVRSAMEDMPDPNVIVQRRLNNLGVECIVRGYVWGSFARDYEAGQRTICGIDFPSGFFPKGLLRYQKFDTPQFTPTTKAEKGKHDENMTFEQVIEKLGEERAKKVKNTSLAVYKESNNYTHGRGLIIVDTKYEFGEDEKGNLFIIDEASTPDSSRLVRILEWNEKFPQIVQAMHEGDYQNVSKLLEDRPELKIKEESKQYVRDIIEATESIELTDEQVIETSLRYIQVYETFTGKKFDFETATANVKRRIVNNLADKGYIQGGCIAFMLASERDKPHAKELMAAADVYDIAFMAPFYGSAHKETEKVLAHHEKLNQSIEPMVIITSAGRSDGLGPVSAGNSRFPVIACNPYKDIATYAIDVHSSLRAPSKLPLAVIVDPRNAVLYAKKVLELKK